MLTLMLDRGFDIKKPLLNTAASHGEEGCVRVLLDWGFNVNYPDEYKRTPLYLAAIRDHAAIVRLLLDQGADPYYMVSYGFMPLLVPSLLGYKDVACAMLDSGVNPRRACIVSMDLDGKTALSYALSEGAFAVSELLLTAGATEDFARIGEEDLILRALEHGHTRYSPLLSPGILDYNDESGVDLLGRHTESHH